MSLSDRREVVVAVETSCNLWRTIAHYSAERAMVEHEKEDPAFEVIHSLPGINANLAAHSLQRPWDRIGLHISDRSKSSPVSISNCHNSEEDHPTGGPLKKNSGADTGEFCPNGIDTT